jgi:hypothetical protein
VFATSEGTPFNYPTSVLEASTRACRTYGLVSTRALAPRSGTRIGVPLGVPVRLRELQFLAFRCRRQSSLLQASSISLIPLPRCPQDF